MTNELDDYLGYRIFACVRELVLGVICIALSNYLLQTSNGSTVPAVSVVLAILGVVGFFFGLASLGFFFKRLRKFFWA